jgi:hypothetical protein
MLLELSPAESAGRKFVRLNRNVFCIDGAAIAAEDKQCN